MALASFPAQPESTKWGIGGSRSYCWGVPDPTAEPSCGGDVGLQKRPHRVRDQEALRGSLLETPYPPTSSSLSPGLLCAEDPPYPKPPQPSSPHFLPMPLQSKPLALLLPLNQQGTRGGGTGPIFLCRPSPPQGPLSSLQGACFPVQVPHPPGVNNNGTYLFLNSPPFDLLIL